MKKPMILLICSLFTLHASLAQQYGWTDISANLPDYANYNDIHFIGEEVWISGGNDKVFYSPDGGETFLIQTLPENSGISSSIFMKNNQEGYCITYSGDILKTGDGGSSWNTLYELGGTLNSIQFPPSSNIGYACGENGKVYSFSNTEIVDISPDGIVSSLQSIYFPVDTSEGRLCGQNIIRRYFNDTWDNLQYFDNAFLYNSIFLNDNSTGWVVGSEGKIFKTIDGISWLLQTSNTTSTLNDVFFIDSLEGWAAGSQVLLHTLDGGVTWTQELASLTVGMELRAIYFTSAHNGYVVGNGVLLKYGEVSGIGDGVESLAFEIFPNPANDKFKVQCQKFFEGMPSAKVKDAKIEVYDLNGRKLLERQIKSVSETIKVDVSQLESGVYFCRLISENKSATQKLIIQR